MKKIIAFLVVFLFVVSCAPSPESVQKAMTQTQLALPTNTPTPTNTPSPIPTNTPSPISTNTPTPIPEPPLSSLIISTDSFFSYKNDFPWGGMEFDVSDMFPDALENYGEMFLGLADNSSVSISLYRMENEYKAASANEKAVIGTKMLANVSGLIQPDDLKIGNYKGEMVAAGFHYKDVYCLILATVGVGSKPESIASMVQFLTAAQYKKLKIAF